MVFRQKIREAARLPVIKQLVWFFESPFYPAVYAFLALLSSLFGLEISFFALTALVIVFTCVFSHDSKPLITPVIMTVYGMSWKHTPQYPFSSEFLNTGWVQGFLIACGVILVASLLFRAIVFPNGRNFFKESRQRLGIALLSLAFLLNGAFFGGYDLADLPFGLLMALSFFAFYIFFFVTLNVEKNTGVYVAHVMLVAGGLVFLQLIRIYLFNGVFSEDGVNKDLIIAGWGMSNNIGAALCMFFSAGFYLAAKCRRGWLYYVAAFVLFLGVCLTQSRASALVGAVILVVAAIILSVKNTPVRLFARIFNCVVLVFAAVFAAIFRDFVSDVFATFFDRGFSDSGRFEIWKNGILNFLRAPVFGVGFYEPIAPDWSYGIDNWVFPDMYHNIFVQILASCGIFGLTAYCVHLAQTVFALRKKPDAESLYYISILLCIFGMSLFDNHLFHVFTALVYSLFLLLSEREGEDGPILLLRPLFVKRKKRIKSVPAGEENAVGGEAAGEISRLGCLRGGKAVSGNKSGEDDVPPFGEGG